jgi:hypothetical protein
LASRTSSNGLSLRAIEFVAQLVFVTEVIEGSNGDSWNELMWAVGESIDPSPTIAQALTGGLLLANSISGSSLSP